MQGMNSESVDLIYLDPPFNSKKNYSGKVGSKAEGANFVDKWVDINDFQFSLIEKKYPALLKIILATLTKSDRAYLTYMAIRLLEMRRILKPTGSIYLHCDPTMSHYLKLVMDTIFGRANFKNEIVWCYGGRGVSKSNFNKKHDIILFYGAGSNSVFNSKGASRPVDSKSINRYNKLDTKGRKYAIIKNKNGYSNVYLKDVIREDWWVIPYVRGKEYTGLPYAKTLTTNEVHLRSKLI